MINGKTLTGREAITEFGLEALIGRQCVVACGTSAHGPVPSIGIISDPQACSIDVENPQTALYVDIEGADDWWLYEVFNDEHFVLLSEVPA